MRCIKRDAIALSSTEAEYMAGRDAAKEVVWMTRLMKGLNRTQSDPTPLYVNNMSASRLMEDPTFHERSKHIYIRYHLIRHQVKNGNNQMNHVYPKNKLLSFYRGLFIRVFTVIFVSVELTYLSYFGYTSVSSLLQMCISYIYLNFT